MQVYLRNDLKNLYAKADNEIVKLSEEIVSQVLDMATYYPGNMQYTRNDWNLKLNKHIMDKLCLLLRKTFPDSSVYFISETNLTLIVDWSYTKCDKNIG
jgi:hypothetical protein